MESKLLVIIVILTLVFISTTLSKDFYVKPSNASSSPSNYASCYGNEPCLTLDQYNQHSKIYFKTGAIFLFLSGNHSLHDAINLTSVSDIKFIRENGTTTVTIICKTGTLLQLQNVSNLLFKDMMFFYSVETPGMSTSAFIVVDSTEISFQNSSFQVFSTGQIRTSAIRAIYISNSNITIMSCSFKENKGDNGGAMYARRSRITISGSLFTGNKARKCGGAIYVSNSLLVLKGNLNNEILPLNSLYSNKVEFTDNIANDNGGAIYTESGHLQINGNSLFVSNNANFGGSLHLLASNFTLSGKALFENNSAGIYGGAIYSLKSTVLFSSCHLHFAHNTAKQAGGAYLGDGCSLKLGELDTDTHKFMENSAGGMYGGMYGGAIHFQHGYIKLSGSSQFRNNFVDFNGKDGFGGAINVLYSTFILSSNALFSNNHAQQGGAIYIAYSTATLNGSNIDFVNNSAQTLGGGLAIGLSTLRMGAGTINFIGNTAVSQQGGAFVSLNSITSTSVMSSLNFINNTAGEVGGAVLSVGDNITFHNVNISGNSASAFSVFNSHLNFSGYTRITKNSGHIGGGITTKKATVCFSGVTKFEENSALESGGAMSVEYMSRVSFSGETSFINNKAGYYGGAIHGYTGNEILFKGISLFENNKAEKTGGGAIYVADSHITFENKVTFNFNFAPNGGAMYFENGATLNLNRQVLLTTSHNYATQYGGAIYHYDSISPIQCAFLMDEETEDQTVTLPDCFLNLLGYNNNSDLYAINSYNDSAEADGNFLYGGLLDKCRIFTIVGVDNVIAYVLYTVLVGDKILNTKAMSSQTYILCFCQSNQKYNCSKEFPVKTQRGQTFSVSLLALSQGDTITSTTVTAKLSPTARLKLNQSSQNLDAKCSLTEYTMYSTQHNENLVIYPNGSCRDTGQAQAVVRVEFWPCPNAFSLSGDHCICEERLQAFNAECIIADDGAYITRKSNDQFWLNALYKNGTYQGLIIFERCPVQYCTSKHVNITLKQPDTQCNLNRTGFLCGACATNYSLMLGDVACGMCLNSYLALLPAFGAAGVVLVIFLSIIRLTVATGMINSVILYANIIQANRQLFFPSSSNILTVFIAWINLDFGFQTCFYRGMDAYAHTWLQFVFPLYVWALVSLIIVASRYSILLTKLIGSNPIAVLATLLLMSYTKILKIVIEVYSFGTLEYPNNKTVIVWLKDANVPYFKLKHIILMVVITLVLILLVLPYTLVLLFGYKLYRISGNKYFRWLNRPLLKIKPLLDSYYAPYNAQTRFWTGFLLLLRCALYVVFSFNSSAATTKSINVSFTAVIVIAWFYIRIYKSIYVNIIEISVYINLIILSVFESSANSTTLVNSLVGIVFATTIIIIIYHFHLLYIAKSSKWLKLMQRLNSVQSKYYTSKQESEVTPLLAAANNYTNREAGLREPLLAD